VTRISDKLQLVFAAATEVALVEGKGQLQQLLNWVNKLAASGELQRWAKQVSDRLVQIGKALVSFDWVAFGRDIADAAKAIGSIARAILWFTGGVKGLIDLGVALIIGRIRIAFYGLATALGVVSVAGLPIWAVVAIVAALAFGAYKLITSWSKVTAFFGRMWAGIKTAFANGVNMVWNALPAWMRGILTGAAFVVKVATGALSGSSPPGRGQPFPRQAAGPRLGPPVAAPSAGPSRNFGKAEVGGRIDLRVTTDSGTKAKVTRMSSVNRNVPLDVTRGAVAFG
jgi:hypothetical protein